MREILFRGKRVDNGGWVEGYYAVKGKGTDLEKHFIVTSTFDSNTNAYPFYFTDNWVEPETICQYTGLTDKNGRKIFEGDIVKDILSPIVGIVRYGRYGNTFNEDGYGGHVGFYVEWKEKRDLLRKDLVYWINESEFIGNIFDNPELIGDKA